MLFQKSKPAAPAAVPASAPSVVQGAPRDPAATSEARTVKAAHSAAAAQTASTLNPHLAFEGTLKYSGSLTVDCEVKGSILTDDRLVIGPAAVVTAEISAGVVEISGKVHGNVKARNRVKILAGGQVCGNIETPTLSMEEGVVFEGNCTRPAALPSAAQPARVAAAPARPREAAPALPRSEVAARCETVV